MDWSHIFFGELQIILFKFSFFWSYFDFVKFCFFKTDIKFLMKLMFVVVAWFCCSSWLAFLLLAYLMNLMHHLLLHRVICFGDSLFVHTPIVFFEKKLGFSICSSFGRQLCQNFGWAGSEPYVRSHITEPLYIYIYIYIYIHIYYVYIYIYIYI